MERSVTFYGPAIVAIIFLAGCATSSAPGVRIALDSSKENTETGSSLAKGRKLFNRGEYALAIEAFRLAVREAPDVQDGYNGLASAYDMMGRFDLSGTYYEMALARAPADGRIYRNMARSLKMQGRTGESEALLAEWNALERRSTPTSPAAPEAKMAYAELPQPPAPAIEASIASPGPAMPILRGGQAIAIEIAETAPIVPDKAVLKTSKSVPLPASQAQPFTQAEPSLRGTNVTITLDVPKPVVAHAHAAIRIMNADGRKGIARRMQGYLAKSGIGNTQIGDSNRRFGRSWLVYPRSAQDQALALKKRLPFATNIAVDNRATRVVLLLGRNAANYDMRYYSRVRRT